MQWTIKVINKTEWHPVFAWWPFRFKVYREVSVQAISYFPTPLEYAYEDRIVWLEFYFRKYLPDCKEPLYRTQADMALERLTQEKA